MTTSLVRPAAPPRYMTPRDHTLATYGPAVAKVAGALGRAPMPWQRDSYDLIGEVLPDGRFRHPFVVVTVQRQAGKTDGLAAPLMIHRSLYRPRQQVWVTAQTGKDAGDKWGELVDLVRLDGCPLRELTNKPKRTNGSQRLPFVNGSHISPHPPTREGLHGKQGDLNVVDEGWAHDDVSGGELQQAIVPIQATRPYRQTIVMSTEGDARSTWFAALVDRGRAGDPTVCLIDYGIGPDVDPDDMEAVAAAHPAFGYTIDLQALVDARAQLGAGDFARAYGNRRTGAAERVIPLAPWTDAATDTPIPAGAPVSFGIAVSADRADASIVAVALVDGMPLGEVVESRPGTSWVAPRVVELTRHRPVATVIDRIGPAAGVAAELERAGVELLPLRTNDTTAAAGDLLERIAQPDRDHPGTWHAPRLRYRPHDQLDAAAAVAARRYIGDGAWLWSRRGSAGSVAPLEALGLAVHGLLAAPAPAPPPMIYTGRR